MKRKKILYISLGILFSILLILFSIFFYYSFIMKKTIKKITSIESSKSIFSVYVLTEDKAQKINDMIDYIYGTSQNVSDDEGINEVILKLEENFGKNLNLTEYDNMFTMIDGLKGQKVQAIILNEAYKDSIPEVEGYEWVEEGIRKVDSFEFSIEREKYDMPKEITETFSVYISGIDTYGGITARSRSDVNILAVINMKKGKILMISTPRDYYVDFDVTGGKKDKLTHAGIYGVESSMDALERLYGIDINYYVKVNFSGFVQIIDAIGGIEVYSDYDFSVNNIKEYHKGVNKLNGIEALAFARERYSFASGDYQRGKHQMEVIRAVVEKLTSTELIKNYVSIMDAVSGAFETNIPKNLVEILIKKHISKKQSWEISSYVVSGTGSYSETFSMPGKDLYVIIPDKSSVDEAKGMISNLL